MKQSTKISFSRWIDLIFLTFVACSIYFFLLSHVVEPLFFPFFKPIRFLPLIAQWWVYSLIFALVWWPVIRGGGFSAGGFLTIFYYPPFWLACIICIVLIWFVQPHLPFFNIGKVPQPSFLSLLFAFGTAAMGAGILKGCHELYKWLTSSNDSFRKSSIETATKPVAMNISELLRWIEKETPISIPDQDMLNKKLFAIRIAEILKEVPLKAVSLVGGYGAGKSSILNMIHHYLQDDKRTIAEADNNCGKTQQYKDIIRVEVCGWGLEKGSTAETILKQVVLGCARHVDCFALTNLPAQYSATLGSASSWWEALSDFFSLRCDPMETLERLDQILLAINKKLVVFLEDLDRNWQGNDFWGEVVSLLDRLKRLERVSFVLAITETGKKGDVINRISDHVEVIPKISTECVASIYEVFRDYCLQKYNDFEFFKKENPYRERLMAVDIKGMVHIENRLNVRIKKEIEAITDIIDNPRNLKHILRRTHRAWSALHGEIDFNDLFVANALRVAVPEVFVFIHENHADIEWLGRDGKREEKDKEREILHTRLEQNCSATGSKLQNVKELIRFLFPYWVASVLDHPSVIQGVSRNTPTDYWDRLIREKLDDIEISDQEVARAITQWEKNHDSIVYKGLRLAQALNEITELPEKIEQIGGLLLDGREVRVLAQQLFEVVFKEKELFDRDFNGRNELIQLALKKDFPEHGDWVMQEVKKIFPLSLSAAIDIYQDWSGPMFYTTESEAQLVRNAVLEGAKSSYSDMDTFINAIKSTDRTAVLEFIEILSQKNYGGTDYKPEEWTWLANLLLDAASIGGPPVLRQIMTFGITHERRIPASPSIWSQDLIQSLFQKRERDVMALLSEIDVSLFEEQDRRHALFARDQANQWLSKLGSTQ